MFDLESLSLSEISEIENLSGLPITAIANDESPKGAALAAMAYIAQRKVNPEFTWNEANSLTIREANAILGLGESAPTDEDDEE